MKTITSIPIHEQVFDRIYLANLLLSDPIKSDELKFYPGLNKIINKLTAFEIRWLIERIESKQ